MDKDLKLGYEYIGDMLFFGELHDDGDKLKDIWFAHDLKDYNDQYKTKCIRRCEYLIATNNTRATESPAVDVEALKCEVYEYFGDLSIGMPIATQQNICEFLQHLASRNLIRTIPNDMVLVPREPTEAMYKAAHILQDDCAIKNYGGSPTPEDYWNTMIKAYEEGNHENF